MQDIFGYPVVQGSHIIIPIAKKPPGYNGSTCILAQVISPDECQAISDGDLVMYGDVVMLVDNEFVHEYNKTLDKYPWTDRHKIGDIVVYHVGYFHGKLALGHITSIMTCGFTIAPFPQYQCEAAYRDHDECFNVTDFMINNRPEFLI